VLAAICIISMADGHKAVLSAFSDYRIEYSESFRFEELIRSLKLPDTVENEDENGSGTEEDGVWEARTASMSLINSLTTCPNSLEDRIFLRDEFTRRGLNELMVVRAFNGNHLLQVVQPPVYQTLRYVKPPESLLTQLDVYTEEKFEDEADMRARARSSIGDDDSSPDLQDPFEDLIQQAKQHGDLYPTLSDIVRHCVSVIQRNISGYGFSSLSKFNVLTFFIAT
jgi:diaphanous 1